MIYGQNERGKQITIEKKEKNEKSINKDKK
jgi:hypothetical protein